MKHVVVVDFHLFQVCVDVEGERFVAAAAGEHHTLVVNQYGDVSTFGRGREGQLGHGEASRLDTADVPRKVGACGGEQVPARGCIDRSTIRF